MAIESKIEKYIVVFAIVGVLATGVYNMLPSRTTWNPRGKKIEYDLPKNFHRLMDVSSSGNESEIMITYETIKGDIITKEYNKGGMFETEIRWKRPAHQIEKPYSR